MTFFVYILLAVRVRHTVTVASSPSGTCVARRRRDTTATLSRWRLHRRRRGGAVSWRRHRRDDGPDVFQRLEIEKETTLMEVRWSRVSWTRRDAARRTFATMMPIIKTRDVTASWPMPSAAAKKLIPNAKAIAEMIWMKWWISLLMGVCSASCVERHNHETALTAPSTPSTRP
jgi:hypothetical protein